MSARLRFPDPLAAADLVTFAGRAALMGADGLRLQASAGTLAMTTAVLAPRGLLDPNPTVLGMRILSVDPALVCDLVVEPTSLQTADDDARAVALPDTAIAPAWAGIAPPRGDWEPVGEIAASVLAARAQEGMARVADELPESPGEDVVRAVRGRVWGPSDDALLGLPAGVAFAAFGLGFIGGDERAVARRSGTWSRITVARGHVLVRGPVRSGLTPVRRTGA
ncbi:hypothetical protein [Microbacterium sp.]|uniref:hypothetical protein n=1 Tax=Microbacterium sp. TaxID=51671 RepID=UPI00092647CA|nr:hypothetical protein [Microbacterium sp.]MBN9191448.1 hypothetical protein [Microbacterium sp.]OJU58619.1 MAG: hypothetical protein BGO04_06105 [Microbacterium sp. 70-38]